MMETLVQLHADIETRARAILANHPGWPCRMGCDGCCRRLAEMPRLTTAEWRLLCKNLAKFSPEALNEIGQDIAELADQASRPLICPLLDRPTGACRVYAGRPLACRTYGFYLERGVGLYCRDIEARVADGTLADVIWGNQDAMDRRATGLGERRELTEWFDSWAAEGFPDLVAEAPDDSKA